MKTMGTGYCPVCLKTKSNCDCFKKFNQKPINTMKYEGKLYGKVGGKYFPLVETWQDFERLEKEVLELKRKLDLYKIYDTGIKIENNEIRDTNT